MTPADSSATVNGAGGQADGRLDGPIPGASPDPAAQAAASFDVALRSVVLEIERDAADKGWDLPARLFALVPTADLLAQQPALAAVVGVDPEADLTGSLTPVEQDELPPDQPIEDLLAELMWPEEVIGTAVVVERLVLPPSVGELPDDPSSAQALAESHPDRQEVRMVAAATRAGSTYCALRLRAHDDRFAVIEGPDLVPALLELLLSTLDAPEQ